MITIDFNKIYSTTNYGDYMIIENLGYINNDSRLWVKIKFLHTGYEKNIRYDYIGHDIVDPYYPRIHGVACIGEDVGSRNQYKKEYDRWINMISRCYNPKSKDYIRYGAEGVTVSDDWLIFSNYLNDIKTLPGYNFKSRHPDDYQLDKDYLQYGVPKNKMVYSKETCIWAERGENSRLQFMDRDYELPYVDRNGQTRLVPLYHLIDK